MKRKKSIKTKTITIRIDKDLYELIKLVAREYGISLSIASKLISRQLEKNLYNMKDKNNKNNRNGRFPLL